MISIFILIVIAIAVSAAAGFGILTLIKSSETALLVQRNQVRLDTVANGIRSYVRVDGDRVLVPISLLEEDGDVPADLKARIPAIAPFATTTWGAPLVYCPASPDDVGSPPSGTTAAVISNDLHDGIEVIQAEVTKLGGVAYVSAGGPGNAALLAAMRARKAVALIISPDPNATDIPRCADVALGSDGATFIVEGGAVVAVYDVPRDSDGHVFVLSPDGSLPAGFSAATKVVRTLADAAHYIDNYGVRDASVYVRDGSTNVTAAELSALAGISHGRSIRLLSRNGGTLSVAGASGAELALAIDGDFELSGVDLASSSADIGFDTSSRGRLLINNAAIGFVRNAGGEVTLRGDASVVPGHSGPARQTPILSTGGRITIDNVPAVVNSALAGVGVFARGGDVTVLGSTSMTLAGGAAPFRTAMGGRILRATAGATVAVNGATMPITSVTTFGSDDPADWPDLNASDPDYLAELQRRRQSMSWKGADRSLIWAETPCADEESLCQAACPGESVVAWGECSSSNDFPLAGFGAAEDGRSWTCRWASPSTAAAPTAKVVCANLP